MRFVIICAPRTGSSHLVSVLGGHPDVLANGNVFDARRNRLYAFWPKEDLTREVKTELIDLRARNPEEFLERIFSKNYGKQHVGFKIFRQENDAVLHRMIEDDAIRKIVLYRRNILAIFSSARVARKTGKYGIREESEKIVATPKIKFDEEWFIKFHQKYTSFFRDVLERLNRSQQQIFFVNYEDINEPPVLGALLTFIGANPSANISPENQIKRHRKQNSTDILSRFQDPDVVQTFLHEHGLLHWMHEGELGLSAVFDGSES